MEDPKYMIGDVVMYNEKPIVFYDKIIRMSYLNGWVYIISREGYQLKEEDIIKEITPDPLKNYIRP